MTFEEYAATMTWHTVAERTKAKAVWQYQQERIDELVTKVEWLQSVINNAMLPEGHALVPIEPTEAMIDAGYLAVVNTPLDEARPAYVCYKAMVEKAQSSKRR